MKWNYELTRLCVGLCLLKSAPRAYGVVLETRYSFPAGPTHPYAGLVRGSDGNFYGTTMYGGMHGGNYDGYGTVFSVTTNGAITALSAFNGYDGANPQAGLIQGSDGNFYGTTRNGGAPGFGTVFRVTTTGALSPLVKEPVFQSPLFNPSYSNTTFTFSFSTVRGKAYKVEWADSLAHPAWNASAPIPGDDTVKTFSQTNPLSSQKFYRVRVQ